MKKTIDMTPTWEASAMIYAMVLQNPEASPDERQRALLSRPEVEYAEDVQKIITAKEDL